jgi:amidase
MSFELPDFKELQMLAKELNFSLDDKQAAQMSAYMAPFAEGYQYLDAEADCLPEIKPLEREYKIPAEDENKFGAWLVKSAIKLRDSGPLHGKRIVVKDNIFVAGLPLTGGSSILEDFKADYDAATVKRLLEAGAEIAGKSVCEYFCLSGGSCTSSAGIVQNPRRYGYSTGGSSSGSAALVVAEEVDMALGTDQGGSVRIPASWTGCYGMKATMGVVPYTGGMAMETSIDYIGPLTNSVSDNALLLEVLAGYGEDPELNPWAKQYSSALGLPIEGLKIGVLNEGFQHPMGMSVVDECVQKAAKQLSMLGATVEEVSVPEHASGLAIWGAIVTDGYWQSLKLNGLGYNYDGVYSPSLFHAMADVTSRVGEMPINGKLLMLLGKYIEKYKGQYYARAKNQVRALINAYDRAFKNFDLLLMPTTVRTASKNPASLAEESNDDVMASAFGNTFNTCQFNATGHPAMSIPCGLRDELPVGMMLVGKHFQETLIYQVAHAYEQSVDWQSE